MFIEPIKRITSVNDLSSIEVLPKKEDNIQDFRNILNELIDNVVETDRDLTQKEYLLATGEIEDPHTVPIAAAMAQASTDLLIQVRNRALESYNELMRISL